MLRVLLPLLACAVSAPIHAQSVTVSATVSGQQNIYGAGLAAPLPSGSGCGPASNGLAPTSITIPPGSTSFRVVAASGFAFCAGSGFSATTPDGPCATLTATNLTGENNLSDTVVPTSTMFVTGVFLGPNPPIAPAPPALNAGTGFASLSPLLQQTFFIGDGLTGTGSGAQQIFNIPAGATRLFLGFADGFSYTGPSGCFDDNGGSVGLELLFLGAPPAGVPTQSVPGLVLLAGLLAAIGLGLLLRRA